MKAAITAPYLKPAEAAALRVAHGVPTTADLAVDVRDAILWHNTAALYGLSVPAPV